MLENITKMPELKPLKGLAETPENALESSPLLRLSILTQFYPPDYAATGQFIEELAQQLTKQGMSIHVFTGQPGYAFKQESAPPLEFLEKLIIRRSRTSQIWPKRIRGRAVNGLIFCLRSAVHLLKACWRGDMLLFTTEPPYLPAIGLLVNLCFGIPYFCLLYDLYPDVPVALNVVKPNHWLARFWDWLNRWIWKQSKGIIVLSSTMKDRIVAKCPEVHDKISVIHSWSDPRVIRPIAKQDNWFAKAHHLTDKFTVIYSGNMGRCHDMETILAAAEELQNEPIQFVFIGAGAKQPICVDIANKLSLKNCLFLPYQDKETLPYSLSAADLSLVSIQEGLEGTIAPSKLYGILASGRPVAAICESHSYLRQLLADANCGAAFNNGDSQGLAAFIRQLAADQKLVDRLGNSGRQYLKTHFTPEIIAEQYFQAFNPPTPCAKTEGTPCFSGVPR